MVTVSWKQSFQDTWVSFPIAMLTLYWPGSFSEP